MQNLWTSLSRLIVLATVLNQALALPHYRPHHHSNGFAANNADPGQSQTIFSEAPSFTTVTIVQTQMETATVTSTVQNPQVATTMEGGSASTSSSTTVPAQPSTVVIITVTTASTATQPPVTETPIPTSATLATAISSAIPPPPPASPIVTVVTVTPAAQSSPSASPPASSSVISLAPTVTAFPTGSKGSTTAATAEPTPLSINTSTLVFGSATIFSIHPTGILA